MYTDDAYFTGTWLFKFTVVLENFIYGENQIIYWNLTFKDNVVLVIFPQYEIKMNTRPYFLSPLEDATFYAGNMYRYTLPEIFDLENDYVTIEINSGEAVLFTQWIEDNREFIFRPLPNFNKTYPIEIKLQDHHPEQPMNNRYKFVLNVLPVDPVVPDEQTSTADMFTLNDVILYGRELTQNI